MLKHVQTSPRRSTLARAGRTADTVSIDSGRSYSPLRSTLSRAPRATPDTSSTDSSRGHSPARGSLAHKFDTISVGSSRDFSPLRAALKGDVDSFRGGFSTLRSSRARSSQRSDTPSVSSSSSGSLSPRRSPRSRSTPRELVRDAVRARQALGHFEGTLSSRSSSYTSLNDTLSSTGSASVPDTPTATLRLYTRCIRPDLEYRTMSVKYTTTCGEIVRQLLAKYRLKHRDPKLYNISLEVATRGAGATVQTVLDLDDDACPAQLQACYPRADSRFIVRPRPGGAVKVIDSILMAGSLYKSLMISERTTAREVIQLLLNCYDSDDSPSGYSLYEMCNNLKYERKLHEDDCPLALQREFPDVSDYSLIMRKKVALTPRTGREFPVRQSFVRWSRSRQSLRPVEHQRRSAPRLPPTPLLSCDSENDSDDDDVFYI
ncbi:uncharacterized protein LOC122370989 [Amphibalanus amphitrite]|uniref:uncharacterized protein LOC122370989 n=1 Tax=Amphibalanus amphitrite TaxID=1232801 RepID=UPI001C90B9E6|nr:uncharacterized protein LOC122370989 [Amphibalanus amphitrite]XP_043202962.1 uncharacterized protein LOC122370989 [Amphibalanus amphitrite]